MRQQVQVVVVEQPRAMPLPRSLAGRDNLGFYDNTYRLYRHGDWMLFLPARRCYNYSNTAAIVQWQNAALWQRMSWVRNPLAAPNISPFMRSNLAPHTQSNIFSRHAGRTCG